jgi:hypothetical protein
MKILSKKNIFDFLGVLKITLTFVLSNTKRMTQNLNNNLSNNNTNNNLLGFGKLMF